MKNLLILLLLALQRCDGQQIVKRLVNDQNSTTDDSFQINVSAGYGVHSENITVPSPVYKPKVNNTDQVPDSSEKIQEVVAVVPTYQVHEKSDIQEKNYQIAKPHRYRPGEKKLRQRNKEEQKEVRQEANLTGGTKIVEVLRVPAMYELHLQSDPQRLAALNTAWLTKLISQNQKKQYQPQASMVNYVQTAAPQQRYQNMKKFLSQKFGGLNQQYPSTFAVTPQKLIPHQQNQNFGYYKQRPQMYQNFPAVFDAPNYHGLPSSESVKKPVFDGNYHGLASSESAKKPVFDAPNYHGFASSESAKKPVFDAPNYYVLASSENVKKPVFDAPNYHGLASENVKKPVFDAPNYHSLASSESSKKPVFDASNYQTYHNFAPESVKKPVVDNYQNYHGSHNLVSSGSVKKPETSTVGYHLSNEISDYYQKPQALHEVPAPVLDKHHKYGTRIRPTVVPTLVSTVSNLVYGKPVDPPYQPSPSTQTPLTWSTNLGQNFYQNQYDQPQTTPEPTNFYQETNYESRPQYQKQNVFNDPNYQGYRNVQNYYNEAIGDNLDQNLLNINSGVATYINPEGTMTVSNLNHQPKLYQPSGDYEIPVTKNQEETPQDLGMMYQNNDLGYHYNVPEQSFMLPALPAEQSHTQSSDLPNLVLNSGEEPKYESRSYGKKPVSRRMYQTYGNKRRVEPMDYILYIKERTLD